MRILVGDVGGTSTRLALWDGGALVQARTTPSGARPDLAGHLADWLRETNVRPDAASLAVAGPVHAGRCIATNLPWVVDAHALGSWLGIPVRVLNDFEAAARGTALLRPGDWEALLPGHADPHAPRAVLGAGTGLGEAFVIGDTVLPGEGGHVEFGPTDAREVRLAGWLIEHHGRASWEDVLSGPGLVNLARFDAADRGERGPDWLDRPDAAAHVVAHRPDLVAWFCALYGTEAGNMALRVLARGGVWICGGIAPRMLAELRDGAFARRFHAKGKIAGALDGIPVRVVTHPELGLLGAASVAFAPSPV
jgi:glucokinase